MRVFIAALLMLGTALVVADEHFRTDLADDDRDSRQVEFSFTLDDEDQGRGFGDYSLDSDGFFSGNNLPRPSGLLSLGDLDEPPPSGGFEPNPPVGGPSPFTIPELSAPISVFPQFPGPPNIPALRSPAPSDSPALRSPAPSDSPALPSAAPGILRAKKQPQKAVNPGKDGRPRGRRPSRRPQRLRRPFSGGARPFRPQRESVVQSSLEDDFGPISGGRIRGNGNRGREEGVMGFIESFRRLIRRII